MTAADRLKLLSGLAGVSAATMLLAIGAGSTTGEALTDYSQLTTGTAAEHLLVDQATGETIPPGGSTRRRTYFPPTQPVPDNGMEVVIAQEDEIVLACIMAAVTQGMLT